VKKRPQTKGASVITKYSAQLILSALPLISQIAWGQTESTPAPQVAPSQALQKMRSNIYKPSRVEFWAKVDTLLASGKVDQVFLLEKPQATSGAEFEEWKLAMARALIAGGQRYHAQYLLSQVISQAVGTRQGTEALRLMHELAKAGEIDESLLEDVAFELDTKIDEPESRSMIGYYRARALFRKGYSRWAGDTLAEIKDGSTWATELQFDRTQQTLLAGDSAASYVQFEALASSPVTRASTAKLARLALARLIFERRDYKAAISTYVSIDLPSRERARTLNELAWNFYYDRSYGKALGAIRSLKSAYYSPLVSPETYILEMLIYRELCHFKRVKAIASEFLDRYKAVYSTIEGRRPLENVPQFLQMMLQEGVIQKRAGTIQNVRIERHTLTQKKWSDADLQKSLVAYGEKREHIVDAEINRMLAKKVDEMANWFLDLREQVWFLDYESSMRMIQLNEEVVEHYVPPVASVAKPEIIFWPLGTEAWRDELFDYETLINDACQASPLLRLKTNGGEK
jgi:hypothetical protein